MFRLTMVKETGFNSNWVFLNSYSSCSLLLVALLASLGRQAAFLQISQSSLNQYIL